VLHGVHDTSLAGVEKQASKCHVKHMGINHGGQGDESSQNLEWGTLIQIVSRFCHI